MKALTIQQPWASLVALGEKSIETRGWKPRSHPDIIAIHTGQKRPGNTHINKPEFQRVLRRHSLTDRNQFPRGEIIALATLGDFVRSDELIERGELDEQELAFGDFRPGRWCWLITKVETLEEPISIGGKLGLWPMDDDVRRRVLQQFPPMDAP